MQSEFNADELLQLMIACQNYVCRARAEGIIVTGNWKKILAKLDTILAKKGVMEAPHKCKGEPCVNCKKRGNVGYWLPHEDVYGIGYTDTFICQECMEGFLIA